MREQGLSFGEHRAHVVARAFVAAAQQHRERPTAAELAAACVTANVDPTDPARNLDSGHWPWYTALRSTTAPADDPATPVPAHDNASPAVQSAAT
ncbi:T3SS effector HopA1 family protein [Streptomyces albidoflavus]|uniref:T3SS effector HopA1 family protein n=1 Tax=Streptomyces albidoflavus TaxID=1886 RepID=UPI0033E7D1CA